jgi:CAAX prenyl protease-like protein
MIPNLPATVEIVRLAFMAGVIVWLSRPVLDFQIRSWPLALGAGLVIFAMWIAPDRLFPDYRQSVLFTNPLTGAAASSISESARHNPVFLALRLLRSVAIVPVVEELFWRGWLMRRMIAARFAQVPLGTCTPAAFVAVALLFASEHGPYWDVGLAAGILFNALAVKTKSLGDLFFAHAIANACLGAYVVAAGRWEYWL